MRRAPGKAAPPPNVGEMQSAAVSFSVDAKTAAVVALRFPLSAIERQTVLRILARAGNFLEHHLPAGDQDESVGE